MSNSDLPMTVMLLTDIHADLQVDTFQRLVSMPIPDDGMAPNTTLDHDGVAPSEKLFHNIIGSSFQFGVAVPRPFIAGQISPLTKEIIEIPDEYLSFYNDFRSEMIDTVNPRHFYCRLEHH